MSFKTLSAIYRKSWLIDKKYADEHMPLVVSLLKGKLDGSAFYDNRKAYYDDSDGERVEPKNCCTLIINAGVVESSHYVKFTDAPEGSIALVSITGPILKYGDLCSYGSVDYGEMIKAAGRAQNISGIILKIDSPGGQVDGTATLADTIKEAKKPVFAFVDDGMMASAAMWIGSAADKIYASQKTDWIGSIGVFCTLYDWNAYFEKEGLPVHEIYAPQSQEKNKDAKDALKGDYSLVENELEFLCDQFIKTIKQNRGSIASANVEKWKKGAMFYAQDAISVGLIDGIKTFDQAVQELADLTGSGSSGKKSSKNTETMFGKNKFEKISALKGVAADAITEEMMDHANANLTEQGIEHVTLVQDSVLEEMEAASKDLATITKERDDWKEKAEAYGELAGDKPTKTRGENDKQPGGENKKTWVDKDAEHNKYLVEKEN